jgi:pimeloyl-ACP methyl ester carboxylesterase
MLAAWPVPVTSLTLVGHSMGGLVCRAAAREPGLHHALIRRIVCLGSPHRGSPLAQVGHVAADALQRVDLPATRVLGALVDGRSAGVKDLRSEAAIAAGPLRDDLDHLFVAGSLAARHGHPIDDVLGDMLVPVTSAHGPADAAGRPNVWTRRHGRVAHHQLQVDAGVYETVRGWLVERTA